MSIVPTAQIFYLMRTNRLGIVLEHQNILHNNRYADLLNTEVECWFVKKIMD